MEVSCADVISTFLRSVVRRDRLHGTVGIVMVVMQAMAMDAVNVYMVAVNAVDENVVVDDDYYYYCISKIKIQ